jgi:DNA-binding Lrp family transcriptional regulator
VIIGGKLSMEKLLELLEQDCTMSVDQIASAAGIPLEDARAAIKQYEKDGVILERDGKIYAKPCEYHFENPEITSEIREENGAYYLDITASHFAKNIMIEWENADVEPDDNFFDVTNGKVSVLLSGEKEAIFSEMPKMISVYDVQK